MINTMELKTTTITDDELTCPSFGFEFLIKWKNIIWTLRYAAMISSHYFYFLHNKDDQLITQFRQLISFFLKILHSLTWHKNHLWYYLNISWWMNDSNIN